MFKFEPTFVCLMVALMFSGCTSSNSQPAPKIEKHPDSTIEFRDIGIMQKDSALLRFEYRNPTEESKCFNYFDFSAAGIPYAMSISSDGVSLETKRSSIVANVVLNETVSWVLLGPKKEDYFVVDLSTAYTLEPGKYKFEFAIYEANCRSFYEAPRTFPSSRYLKKKIFQANSETPYPEIEAKIFSEFEVDPSDGQILIFSGEFVIKPTS